MTSPDYRPPPAPGWWVKSNRPIFGGSGALTFTGGEGRLTLGKVVFGGSGTLTFTGGTGVVTTGPTVAGGSGALTFTGGIGKLEKVIRGAGSLTFTGGVGTVGSRYSDDFNRADSATSLGSNWTNQLNTMGIDGNAAYGVANATNIATYNQTMVSDDMSVSITLGTIVSNVNTSTVSVILGANSSGASAVLIVNGNGDWSIRYKTGWSGDFLRASITGQSWNTGDVIMLQRVGNVYTVTKNGVYTGLGWVDNSNFVPRDSSHRLVGVGCTQAAFGNYRRIDSWSAANI